MALNPVIDVPTRKNTVKEKQTQNTLREKKAIMEAEFGEIQLRITGNY